MSKKLTKKEHESIKFALQSLQELEIAFTIASKKKADASIAFEESFKAMKQAEGTLSEQQAKLMKKYGNVNVNVSTGELLKADEE